MLTASGIVDEAETARLRGKIALTAASRGAA
jgi:hypothetical protein